MVPWFSLDDIENNYFLDPEEKCEKDFNIEKLSDKQIVSLVSIKSKELEAVMGEINEIRWNLHANKQQPPQTGVRDSEQENHLNSLIAFEMRKQNEYAC
jgi:hypothetical protein